MTHPLLMVDEDSGYNIERSVRLRASASAYLSRTPASATNRQIFTYSIWLKRGLLGTTQGLLDAADTTADASVIDIYNDNTLRFYTDRLSASVFVLTTPAVFRDPAAYYHIVVAVDTTQATNTNRVKIYKNNELQTLSGSYPAQNYSTLINGTDVHRIGKELSNYFDGYLAEVNFIDGQALTPSSFGSTNSTTGVWQPAQYKGTYGANGFYLPFTDNSALTTSSNVGLGKDFSGNGNYWTTNNISITAGVTYDSMTDVPTLTSATAANYAVCNPLKSGATLSQGNLYSVEGGAGARITTGTIGMTSGKYYWGVTIGSSGNMLGVCNSAIGASDGSLTATGNGWGYASDGNKYPGGSAFGATYTTNDVIGIAFDATAGTLAFYKNNVSQGTAFTGLTSGPYFAGSGNSTGCSQYYNFGQRPFSFTIPAGYSALNTYNLPDSAVKAGATAFQVVLDTGANIKSATEAVFSSSQIFEWIKDRANANNHQLLNSVRGLSAVLQSNTTSAETTYSAPSGSSVGLVWKAGSSTVTNTSGSISSQVSVNAAAGFSMLTYPGDGVAGSTVGHGLGDIPGLVIAKDLSSANNWFVAHKSLGGGNLLLDQSMQSYNPAIQFSLGGLATLSSSSTFGFVSGSVNANNCNKSGSTFLALCWAEIQGFSKFGSYKGNGPADGWFEYLGFKPRWLMIKNITTGGAGYDWVIIDTARETYNPEYLEIMADLSAAEANGGQGYDFLSNGFKIRGGGAKVNGSGQTYIYAAFAENPFKYANAR